MKLLEYIARGAAGEAEIMVNPTQEERRVAAGGVLSLVVVHSAVEPSTLEIELGEGAVLHLVEAFSGGAMGSCRVRQGASSRCEITSVVTGSAEVDYAVDMDGGGAENNLRGAFICLRDRRFFISVLFMERIILESFLPFRGRKTGGAHSASRAVSASCMT